MASRAFPEPAEVRFSPYVAELREFYTDCHQHWGAPEDILALAERLRRPGNFAEDMSSLIRSIVLREGGFMPHTQLLEILAVATGGQMMERAPQQYRQPLLQILSFVTAVMKRPWNLPPGEREDVVEFPQVAVEALRVERTGEAADLESMLRQGPPPGVPDLGMPPPPSLELRLEVPEEDELRELKREKPAEAPADVAYAASALASVALAPAVLAFARSVPDAPGLAAVAGPSAATEEKQVGSETATAVAEAPQPPPGPVLVQTHPETGAPWVHGAETQEPAASTWVSRSFREVLLLAAAILLVVIAMPPVLRSWLTKDTDTEASKAAWSAAVAKGVQPADPAELPAPAKAASATSAGSGATAATGAAPDSPSASTSAGTSAPVAGAATASNPGSGTPAASSAAQPVRHRRDDDYVAPPWVTQPLPGQAGTATIPDRTATPPVAAQVSSAPTPMPASETAERDAPTSGGLVGVEGSDRPVGSQQFRASGDVRPEAERPRLLSVSPGVMAGNVLSAPMPDYPMVARIAHVQGEVTVQAVVTREGTVETAHAVGGHHLLRGAAEDAVRQWRYRPYQVEGKTVDVSTTVRVRFRSAK